MYLFVLGVIIYIASEVFYFVYYANVGTVPLLLENARCVSVLSRDIVR